MIVRIVVRTRRPSGGARFVHPVNPASRTAILASGFQSTKLTRVFDSGWNPDIARFAPTSIAGTVGQLRHITNVRALQLQHAVIVFTYEGQAALSDADRDFFWKAFGVPVFEQRLAANNELVAMECEAHSGLHMAGEFGHLRPDKNTCACGNPAPRIARPARPARSRRPVDLVRRSKSTELVELSA